MRAHLAAALLAAAAAQPARAADFPSIGGLAQDEFRSLAQDLGAAFSYKGVTPATPLGTLGLDVGLEVTQTQLENSRLFALAGSGDTSSVLIPKVHIHKGLPANFDISAFVGGAAEFDAGVYGAALRWTLADEGLVYPALSAFEAEKMGENVSLSAKVGWRF